MQLDDGMDTGPVLLEVRTAIGAEETSGELLTRLAPIGAAALLEAITDLEAGRATPVAQDHALATHAAMLEKSHGAIDFTQPAATVASRIRGVDPWPGAQATLRGQGVKLFRAIATPGTAPGTAISGTPAPGGTTAPGTVVAIDAGGAHVACGDGGVVVIREIQAAGRKRMAAQAFAAGRGITVGDVIGPVGFNS
jgi:methionyl-tRNA formyltransferase